jgi:putative membrane protein
MGARDTAAPLTDEQIAAITNDANSAEIDQAKIAEQKAKDPRVKSFASMMVKHHTEAKNKQAKLGLKTASSPASEKMEKDAADTLSALKSASGAAFDIAYMSAQVDEHQKVADTIDHELMPSAKNADLRAYLAEIKPTVESHLKHAKDIQRKLGETASAN